ncbi:putative cation-transporting ATPase 1, partial [Teratosphaeriaceae sp. CCFEE 6253]
MAEICEIKKDNVGGKENTSFLFQKRRFLLGPVKGTFSPLEFKMDEEPKPEVGMYQRSKGLQKRSVIERIQQHYGPNTFDIPVPSFTELFKEHAVAPFFVFQIFC